MCPVTTYSIVILLFLADGRETLRFGLGAPDDDDETDEMEDEERAYAGWG